jgi:hypothetical protein
MEDMFSSRWVVSGGNIPRLRKKKQLVSIKKVNFGIEIEAFESQSMHTSRYFNMYSQHTPSHKHPVLSRILGT